MSISLANMKIPIPVPLNPRALNPAQQEICLSLLGGDAWRLYREGTVSPALLLEMYSVDTNFRATVPTICKTLAAALRSSGFPDLQALTDMIDSRVRALPMAYGQWLHFSGHMLDERIDAVLGIDEDDERYAKVTDVFSLMEKYVFPENFHRLNYPTHVPEFVPAIAAIWFEICDVAATRGTTS